MLWQAEMCCQHNRLGPQRSGKLLTSHKIFKFQIPNSMFEMFKLDFARNHFVTMFHLVKNGSAMKYLLLPVGIVLSACGNQIPEVLNKSYLAQSEKIIIETETIDKIGPQTIKTVPISNDLHSAIIKAVTHHPHYISAQATLRETELNLAINTASTKPQLSASVFSGLDDMENLTAGSIGSVNLQTLLFDSGKSQLQQLSDEVNIEIAKLGLDQVKAELMMGHYQDFNTLNSLKNIEQIYSGKKQIINEYTQRLETMKLAGVIDSTTISAAQRISNDIDKNLALTKIDRELIEEKLKLYFKNVTLPRNSLTKQTSKLNKAKQSLNGNIDVKRAYLLIRSAEITVEQAKKTNSYDVILQSGVRQTIGNSLDTQPTLGISLSKPLYRGGLQEAQISTAEASRDRAISEFETAYSRVNQEIKLIDVNLGATEKKLDIIRQDTDFSRSEIKRINSQLQIGRSSINDLISEEYNLLELELQTIQLKKETVDLKLQKLGLLGIK